MSSISSSPRYPGVLGQILDKCKIPDWYFVNPHSNIFDALNEGFSFVILATEHKDIIAKAVRDDVDLGEDVISGLSDLREYTQRLAEEFDRLSSQVDQVTQEVVDILKMKSTDWHPR